MKKILLSSVIAASALISNAQDCSDLFFSEYVEGSGSNKAIEIYNPTPANIQLDGVYMMGRERNGDGIPMLMPITGTVPAFGVRVFALDKRDPNGTGTELPIAAELEAAADTFLNPIYVETNSPMYFNGNDAFFLIKNGMTIVDLIGKSTEDPGGGWWVPGDPNTAWWTTDNTLIRKATVKHGVTSNPSVFDPSLEWDSLPEDTFTELGEHLCDCADVSVQNNEAGSFMMFPNPIAEGKFSIMAHKAIATVTLMSTDGRLIYSNNIYGDQKNINVELPEAEAGIYFIEIEFMDGTRTSRKLISK
ncbi:MAG: T9SS type A sorting domain-containing protein [Flavobacteriales bacterium]|nr:T9SS type A sorting domain-containing protein [Flavobacteriales bacterium]